MAIEAVNPSEVLREGQELFFAEPPNHRGAPQSSSSRSSLCHRIGRKDISGSIGIRGARGRRSCGKGLADCAQARSERQPVPYLARRSSNATAAIQGSDPTSQAGHRVEATLRLCRCETVLGRSVGRGESYEASQATVAGGARTGADVPVV